MRRFLFFLSIVFSIVAQAQFESGTYGNEWITYGQDYVKVAITENGWYSFTVSELRNQGLDLTGKSASDVVVYNYGKVVPAKISTSGSLSGNDVISFFGKKNTGEFESSIFSDEDRYSINPYYSLFTDQNAYFIGYGDEPNSLIKEIPFTSGQAQSSYIKEEVNSFSTAFINYGRYNINNSYWKDVEGFGMSSNKSFTTTIATSSVDESSSFSPTIELRYSPFVNQDTEPYVLNLNEKEIYSEKVNSGICTTINQAIAASDLKDKNAVSLTTLYGRFGVGYVKILYPRKTNFNNSSYEELWLEASNNSTNIVLTGFNLTGNNIIAITESGSLLETNISGSSVTFTVPAHAGMERVFVINPNAHNPSFKILGSVSFKNLLEDKMDYLIISHSTLRIPYQGKDQVQAYADYRSSAEGGSYEVTILNSEDIIDQFAYGISGHGFGIKNFMDLAQKREKAPENVLLLGKGRNYKGVRTTIEEEWGNTFFVPTFGYPGADNLLVSRFKESNPRIPIGRVPALNTEEIYNYLDKVKRREAFLKGDLTLDEVLWNKKLVILSGGSRNDQALIRRYSENIMDHIDHKDYQANLKPFFKRTTDNVSNVFDDEIYDEINNGSGIVQFYGHSAPDEFDFNISDFTRYDNDLKWPIMIALGCYSGNVHRKQIGIAEKFLFEYPNGYIGFLSSSGPGLVNSMSSWVKYFYDGIYDLDFKTIGNAAQLASQTTASRDEPLSQQFTNLGDPVLRLYDNIGPDYTVFHSDVSINPEIPTTVMDSVELRFGISNLGRQSKDGKCTITVSLKLPSGVSKDLLVNHEVETGTQISWQKLWIPITNEMAGLNKISITVDPNNEIKEVPSSFAESNNHIIDEKGNAQSFTFFVSSSGIVLNYPEDFSIQGGDVVLHAQPSNSIDQNGVYTFELDTVPNFSSVFKMDWELSSSGEFMTQDVTSFLESDQVYYWRASKNLGGGLREISDTRSFIYRPGDQSGWNVSDHYQKFVFDHNTEFITYDTVYGLFEFPGDEAVISTDITKFVDENVGPKSYYNFRAVKGIVDGLDDIATLSIAPYYTTRGNIANPIASLDYTGAEKVDKLVIHFSTQTAADRQEIIDFIKQMPKGYFYQIYTLYSDSNKSTFNISDWNSGNNNLIDFMINEGFKSFEQFRDGQLKPFFGMKRVGTSHNILDKIGTDENDLISSGDITALQGVQKTGSLYLPNVGPASQWSKVSIADLKHYPYASSDQTWTFSYDIIGITNTGSSKIIAQNITNLEYDLSDVSATDFPYLSIRINITSDGNLAPQIDYMRVYYKGLPDITFDVSDGFTIFDGNVEGGTTQGVKLSVKNISPYPIAKSTYDVNLITPDGSELQSDLDLAALGGGESEEISFDVNVPEDPSTMSLVVKLNPKESPVEATYENNTLNYGFSVEADIIPPNIEIYADGEVLVDRELISQNAMIQLFVSDKNTSLLSDPNYTRISLIYPDGQSKIINDDPNLDFKPATSENNMSTYSYPLDLTETGDYQIKVRAEDAKGNITNQNEIIYSFRVETENMISEIYNYPNPFRDRTRFFYRLSGVVPEEMSIKIFTPNGRLVKEITKQEIGDLKVGSNLTEYEWDGRDAFGNKLAPGVYLYKVEIKDASGQLYDQNDVHQQSNKFFKNGYGKMVIVN